MAKARRVKPKGAGRSAPDSPRRLHGASCRAVRIGSHVWVTGSVAVRADGRVFGRGDPEAQTRRCLDVIEDALRQVDARMDHVVRTRIFVVDIASWEAVSRAHHARFAEHPPATSMVEVSALLHPDTLVEIEAEAFIPEEASLRRAS